MVKMNGTVVAGTLGARCEPTHFTALSIWSNTVTENDLWPFRLFGLKLRNSLWCSLHAFRLKIQNHATLKFAWLLSNCWGRESFDSYTNRSQKRLRKCTTTINVRTITPVNSYCETPQHTSVLDVSHSDETEQIDRRFPLQRKFSL